MVLEREDNKQRQIAEQQRLLEQQQQLAEQQRLDNQRLELALRQNELANAAAPPAASVVQPAIHWAAVKLKAFWSDRPIFWFA
uniref:Uncharacterized protein n=1 Tax=Trichogramma kaykai TaxID=54128 RepID=A0ABD2WIF7_9HYME